MPEGTGLRFAGLADLARVKDLSASGVCCETSRPLPLLSQVQVVLLLPASAGRSPHEVACTGAVVRCARGASGFEVAVFFTEMDDPDRAALEAYVTSESLAARAG
ncbi:MAG: PilZ domain-containing protein [Burkholderiales bacterium]|nr:PilZ domain-containing protein [Burkholderiales bacterium]